MTETKLKYLDLFRNKCVQPRSFEYTETLLLAWNGFAEYTVLYWQINTTYKNLDNRYKNINSYGGWAITVLFYMLIRIKCDHKK